jgi:hypothetical protein
MLETLRQRIEHADRITGVQPRSSDADSDLSGVDVYHQRWGCGVGVDHHGGIATAGDLPRQRCR